MRRPSLPTHAALAVAVFLVSGASAAFSAPPVARDDSVLLSDRYLEVVGGVETYSILIDVLANDEDSDGDPLRVVDEDDFGGEPAIWTPDPAGSVQYLGGGVFELTVGKDEIGDAGVITFQYELEGATNVATVELLVADNIQVIFAPLNDSFSEPGACSVRMPVLANDTGADVVQSFTQPAEGEVIRDSIDPNILIYRGGSGGTFTYDAQNSQTGETDSASVTVDAGGSPTGESEIKMADCFDRADGVELRNQPVGYFFDPTVASPVWAANGDLTHLDRQITQSTSLAGDSIQRRRARLPFDADQWTSEGSAFSIEALFLAPSANAQWVALAFTHGGLFSDGDLWVLLNAITGEVVLHGRTDTSQNLDEILGRANPVDDGYTFVQDGWNRLRLRYDAAPSTPRVDVWVNDARALSVPFLDDSGQVVPASETLGSITDAGVMLSYGTKAAEPGDVRFDEFKLWVGDVTEPRLGARLGDPTTGASVESGSRVDVGPLHVGCTAAHENCFSTREESLWVRNDGNVDLEISNLSFSGPSEWSLEHPTGSSLTVTPGTSAEIRVRVDALQTGPTASRLEFSTNDPDLPKFGVDLEAEVTQAPIADFVHFCEGLTCTFDAGRSTGVDLNTFSYFWTFEGNFSFGGKIRSHAFSATGVYTVELEVVDGTGASHVTQRTVSIPPEAAFTFVCANDTRTCDFDAALTTEGVVSFTLDFGDGTTWSGTGDPGAEIVRHEYATSGRYDVTLTVQDGAGQVDAVTHEVVLTPNASFTASCDPATRTCDFDASGSTPLLASYTWSFGDGSPETEGAVQEHRYATSGIFTVTLTVTDISGQTAVHSQPVSIPPQADFTFECDGLLCQFDAGASTPGVESFAWDFGYAGGTATGSAPLHEFPDGGDFEVSLTVTDASGQTDTTTRTVTVFNEEAFLLILLDEQ